MSKKAKRAARHARRVKSREHDRMIRAAMKDGSPFVLDAVGVEWIEASADSGEGESKPKRFSMVA